MHSVPRKRLKSQNLAGQPACFSTRGTPDKHRDRAAARISERVSPLQRRPTGASSTVGIPPLPPTTYKDRCGPPPSLPWRKASGGCSRKVPDAPWLIPCCHPSCRPPRDPCSGPGCRGRRPGSAGRGLAGPLRNGLAGSRRARFLPGWRPSWLRLGLQRSGGQRLPGRARLRNGPERVPPESGQP
jgi:hypothetical protein